MRLAQTLLLGKELRTTSGSGHFFPLSSITSLRLLNLLQRRSLGHFVTPSGPRRDGRGGSLDRGLRLRPRVRCQGLGDILTVTLCGRSGERRRRRRRGHSGVVFGAPRRVGVRLLILLLLLLLLLLLFLLLSLSGCSFLDLLRQSERGFLAWCGALVNNTRAGTGLLRRTDGCHFLLLGRFGSMMGRMTLSILHAEIAFLRSQCMKLTQPVFAGLLLENAFSLSTVKLFLFLL